MASTMPAERDLRRVIGDGDTIPDGEVEGVGEQELLALYRSMVLPAHLRRALGRLPPPGPDRDVRDLLGSRGDPGRRRARARGRGLDLPELPRVGDRAPARHAAATILSWWRGHPAGWWNPADYNLASICVPIATQVPHAAGLAWGKRLAASVPVR
jgi:pyruvate dehydrogenase E1 component alpha subunit